MTAYTLTALNFCHGSSLDLNILWSLSYAVARTAPNCWFCLCLVIESDMPRYLQLSWVVMRGIAFPLTCSWRGCWSSFPFFMLRRADLGTLTLRFDRLRKSMTTVSRFWMPSRVLAKVFMSSAKARWLSLLLVALNSIPALCTCASRLLNNGSRTK